MSEKYDQNYLYCLKCHTKYPNPRYSDNEYNEWIFVTIHHTLCSLAKIYSFEINMIWLKCKEEIKISDIAKLHNEFYEWTRK